LLNKTESVIEKALRKFRDTKVQENGLKQEKRLVPLISGCQTMYQKKQSKSSTVKQ